VGSGITTLRFFLLIKPFVSDVPVVVLPVFTLLLLLLMMMRSLLAPCEELVLLLLFGEIVSGGGIVKKLKGPPLVSRKMSVRV